MERWKKKEKKEDNWSTAMQAMILQTEKIREDFQKVTNRLEGRIVQIENIINAFRNKIIPV